MKARNHSKTKRSIVQAVLEPQTQAFLNRLGQQKNKPLWKVSVEHARRSASMAQEIPVSKVEADIQDYTITEIGAGLLIRIVRPKGLEGELPGVMYFHGGGWVLGDRFGHDRLLRELATGSSSAVVFVEFSRSPEVHYPVAIEEAYAATKWIAENGSKLGIDGSRIAVAGESSGGNMATVVAMLAKVRGGPSIRMQVLFFPSVGNDFNTKSYRKFAKGYFLTRKMSMWFRDQYIPDMHKREEFLATPLKASLDQLSGLPPALIITAEVDVLRDDGEAYARRLIQANVTVFAVRFLATIHGFVFLNAIASTPAARAALLQANALLNIYLKTAENDLEVSEQVSNQQTTK